MNEEYTTHAGEESNQESEMVNQDLDSQGAEQETNWEESAKYFQSEKDKTDSENQKLKTQLDTMGKFLKENPDLATAMKERAQGVNGEQIPVQNGRQSQSINPEDFDAWESFTNPNSESYKFREMQQQQAVQQQVQQQMAGMQAQMAMGKLEADLQAKGLSPEEVTDFKKFASTPANELGLDNVINMWRTVQGNNTSTQQQVDLTQVRQNQAVPTSPGVMQGQKAEAKNSIDKMWDGIVKAGGRSNVL
tara:strand:+ start:1017 stop:1760 length:744 start_codon:yes stop_codon:yes gene_type:complete